MHTSLHGHLSYSCELVTAITIKSLYVPCSICELRPITIYNPNTNPGTPELAGAIGVVVPVGQGCGQNGACRF